MTVININSNLHLQAFTLKLIFLLDVGLYGSLTLLTLLFLKGKRRIDFVGGICAAFAVSVFVAPLSIIVNTLCFIGSRDANIWQARYWQVTGVFVQKLVIRTKSVEYMPFSLSFFLTLSALAWFCYGLLMKDFFIAVEFPTLVHKILRCFKRPFKFCKLFTLFSRMSMCYLYSYQT